MKSQGNGHSKDADFIVAIGYDQPLSSLENGCLALNLNSSELTIITVPQRRMIRYIIKDRGKSVNEYIIARFLSNTSKEPIAATLLSTTLYNGCALVLYGWLDFKMLRKFSFGF